MSVTPTRDRQAERREATRREIVDAAWEIAKRDGLAAVTLREVAARVGMQSPSLYTHFASKNAIYDAMFGQAWSQYLDVCRGIESSIPKPARKALLFMVSTFVDFALADQARFQLMNQRMVVDFEPTPDSYAPLIPARLRRNERNFVLFAGLKGAVPILLGGFILAAHVDQAPRLYGIVVIVVACSVLVQGSLIPAAAGWLRLPIRTSAPEPWALGVRLAEEPEGVHRLTIGAGAAPTAAASTSCPASRTTRGSRLSSVTTSRCGSEATVCCRQATS